MNHEQRLKERRIELQAIAGADWSAYRDSPLEPTWRGEFWTTINALRDAAAEEAQS